MLSSRHFLRSLDVGTLDLFLLTCEHGSIAKAAEKGQIAASALSRRISELEGMVGAPLLERHARGVRATFLGAQLAERSSAILHLVEELRTELSALSLGVRGRVQISASASAVEQFLPDDMRAFSRSHPEIRIELRQGTSREVASDVLNRDADIGVCSASEHVAGLQWHSYRVERLVLVTPCDHPLGRRERIAFADTLDHEQIGMRGSSTVRANMNKAAREARRALLCRVEVDSLSAMCRMIECGMGIGIMPVGALHALDRPQLCAVRLTDAWAEQALKIYAVDFGLLSAAAQHLVDCLVQQSLTE